MKKRATEGSQVLGLRFEGDPMVGKRFETLTRELGDAFIKVEFKGRSHSTVTEHRQRAGVDRVLAFFEEKLPQGRSGLGPAHRSRPALGLDSARGRLDQRY